MTESTAHRRTLVTGGAGFIGSHMADALLARGGEGLARHVDEQDLVSYGLLGLIGAIERFDPDREIKFETYAIARIKGAIIDELRSIDWVPRSVRAKARSVEKAYASLEGQLLRTLYWETEVVLAGGHSAIDRKQRVTKAQEDLRASLPGWSDPEFDAYAARHYPAYWLKADLQHKIAHAKLLRLVDVEVKSLMTEFSTDAFRGVTELTIL